MYNNPSRRPNPRLLVPLLLVPPSRTQLLHLLLFLLPIILAPKVASSAERPRRPGEEVPTAATSGTGRSRGAEAEAEAPLELEGSVGAWWEREGGARAERAA